MDVPVRNTLLPMFLEMADEVVDAANEAVEASEPINVAGLISIIVFYLVVLLIGLWAGWKQRKVAKNQGRSATSEEEVMLAGRDIGLFVGILTMGGKVLLLFRNRLGH